jgi:hypothetical protein
LCGDLIRAVRREAKLTVAYHWGVSTITVYKWRKFLGVSEWNEGSSRLLGFTHKSENAARGSSNALVMAANPKRRGLEFRRLMREITFERLKKVGSVDARRRRPWTPEQDQLLGVLTDDEAAARTGRTRNAVLSRRRRLRKKCPTCSWTHWTPAQVKLLGTMPDRELARRLRRTVLSVGLRRRKLHIPSAWRRPARARE